METSYNYAQSPLYRSPTPECKGSWASFNLILTTTTNNVKNLKQNKTNKEKTNSIISENHMSDIEKCGNIFVTKKSFLLKSHWSYRHLRMISDKLFAGAIWARLNVWKEINQTAVFSPFCESMKSNWFSNENKQFILG